MHKLNKTHTIQELTTEELNILIKETGTKAFEVENPLIADFYNNGSYYIIE